MRSFSMKIVPGLSALS